jgi:hypothetical protein
VTQNLRVGDPAVLRAQGRAEPPRAPQEITGPGVLFPALIVGLGQVGLTVLHKVRELLHIHVAPLTQLGNLRFLLLDTDPEVVRLATRGQASTALGPAETLLTPLGRPSHYLKPREGRLAIDSWLNPRMLYRIPRSQVTTGVRALGRLAFCDNYRNIVRRLQLELDEMLEPQVLENAARATKLGLRTNRPRVYVVTCLGGGTGSGMFLDLAYNVRALLRQMGYENPDVVGLLLLPPIDGSRTRLLPLGNTHAALKELYHFGSPDVLFQARYHNREAPIEDSGPPFSRTVVMPLPDEGDEVATQEVVEQCGQFLFRDLATPLGKVADLGRADRPGPPWEQRGQYFQTFGLFHLAWPRHALVRAVARQVCQKLVQRWLSKDSKPLRQAVNECVGEHWVRLEMGADSFIHAVQAEVLKAEKRPPDALFGACIEPLTRGSHQDEAAGRFRRGDSRRLSAEQVNDVLMQLEGLVGQPDDDDPPETPHLVRLLREAAERVAAQWTQKMVELPVHMIEEPAFRLAGAEEAIRQMVASVESALAHHEPLAHELAEKAQEAHDHLRVAAGRPPREGRKLTSRSAEQIVDLCRQYPKWRFQSLVLQHLATAFVGLRGHLSDELRDVNFCRVRVTELLRLFEESPPEEAIPVKPLSHQGGIGRMMFVDDCKSLPEAVARYLESVTPEQILELDGRVEAMLQANFTALVHVCLTNQNLLRQVEMRMLDTAAAYAGEQLPPTSVAGLFLEQHPDPEEARAEVEDFYHQANPELTPGRYALAGPAPVELTVLAAPEDPPGEQVRGLLEKAVPETEIQSAASDEDILIYRERLNLPLLGLEHMSGQGLDAYNQMRSTDHFTPHARTDVEFRS